jgi:hypothetical protein
MSSRTGVVTQPTYLPWLGYFEQIARADVLVFLDTVQFERRSWQNRNRLRGSDGKPFWLTVPVQPHRRDTPINEIRVSSNDNAWPAKHLSSIQHALRRAPYFAEIFPGLEAWLHSGYELLAEVNIRGILLLKELLGLSSEVCRSSQLQAAGRRAELIVNICREVGVSHYYTAAGSRGYIENEMWRFEDASIEVEFQSWNHPVYPQVGPGFVSHLSAVDALMNLGSEAASKVITGRGTLPAETER